MSSFMLIPVMHDKQNISELTRYLQLPTDWRLHWQQERYLLALPPPPVVPKNGWGWKVRLNFQPWELEAAIAAVRAAAEVATIFGVPLKMLPSLSRCQSTCQKSEPLETAGKLITLYPGTDSTVVEKICRALDARLTETAIRPASAPVSDVKYTDNISLRYGPYYAGLSRLKHPKDDTVFEDNRAFFSLPPWVQMPAFLKQMCETAVADEGPLICDGRYRVLECLHRTFAGGVYTAVEETTGNMAILKEARPHVQLSGLSSGERIRNEATVLEFLASVTVPFTPRVREQLSSTEGHIFLLMDAIVDRENVLASTLYAWRKNRASDLIDTSLLLKCAQKVIECLLILHSHRVAWRDVSPMNVLLVDPDPETFGLKLIDAEYAIVDATDEELRADIDAFGRMLLWLIRPDEDALLNPNIALRYSNFDTLKATPGAYERAVRACFEGADIHQISSIITALKDASENGDSEKGDPS